MLILKHDCKTNYEYSSKNPNRICWVEGCQELGQDVTKLKQKEKGLIRRRKYCTKHFQNDLVRRKGANSFAEIIANNKGMSVTEYRRNVIETIANNRGVSVTAYFRSMHESRRHILDYCENIDGRLGFKCTTTIILDCGMLHGDHKNGVPWDHRPSNLQTLCSCCHSYKSHVFKDYASVGRRAAKLLSDEEKTKIQEEADLRYKETFERFTASNNIIKVM